MGGDELPSRVIPADVPKFIQSARHGSQVALDRLLESYRTYLRRVASRGIGRDLRGKVDPSSIAQITLIEAHRDFHQFESSTHSRLQAWLTRLLRNNLADAQKRYRDTDMRDVSREVPLDSSLKELVRKAEADSRAHDPQQEKYQAAKERLLPHYREVIDMRHIQRLTFVEIGKRLGETDAAARMRYGRAVEALKAEIEKNEQS